MSPVLAVRVTSPFVYGREVLMSTEPTPVAKASQVVPTPTIRFTQPHAHIPAVRVDGDDDTLGRNPDNGYVVADPRCPVSTPD